MSETGPNVETVDESTADGETFATPVPKPKRKVKVPASAPGRTKVSAGGKATKKSKKRTSSLSPTPGSKQGTTSDKTGALKKKKSKKKKKPATNEDNWSLSSSEQHEDDLKEFKEFSSSLPGVPFSGENKLPKKASTKSGLSNTSTLTPISNKKKMTFDRQGSSNGRSVDSSKSPGNLKRRGVSSKSIGSMNRDHHRAGSRSPGPVSRDHHRVGSRSPGPVSRDHHRVGSRSPGPVSRDSYRSSTSRSPGPLNRNIHRKVEPRQSPMTPRRTSAPIGSKMTPRNSTVKSPLRSNSVGAGLSPQRGNSTVLPSAPPLTQSPRREHSISALPLTPRGGRRSIPMPQSPGALASRTPRTPKSARRSVLGGRRATTGLAEEEVKKLEIGPLDDDDEEAAKKKGAEDEAASPEEEEAIVVKKKPYPKSDEDWEDFEVPPKSLVLVWVVVMGELVFDFGTTMIAFRALGEESDCCGYPVTVGAFPMLITAPFFLLVSSEIALLLRAILITMFPSLMKPINLSHLDSDYESDHDEEGKGQDKHDESDVEDGTEKKIEDMKIIMAEEDLDSVKEESPKETKTNISDNDKEEASCTGSQEENKFEDEDENAMKEDCSDQLAKKPFMDEATKRRIKRVVLKYVCCWLQWKLRMLMHVLDFLVLLNPFFGCFIAWVLMYQSDKKDAFTVLGFEAASLALHYISVWLEGAVEGVFDFFMQILLPLVPFVVAVSLVLFYLKQGGVCYLVEDKVFKFVGCEVCVDGYPPVDGTCYLKNGTTYEFVATDLLRVDAYNELEDFVSRTNQVSYCAAQNPTGPQGMNFCFFDFELGQLDGVVVEVTEAPTSLPVLSSSKCGAVVSPGEWEETCRQLLWVPTQDDSMFCFASGGSGDPCHLNIVNDGVNEGRFKDPSRCRLKLKSDGDYVSYGDVLYLWDDPSLYGFDFRWAANAWVAYSITRWESQMTQLRNVGLKVTTPLVNFEDEAQVVSQLSTFFNTCDPHCDDPESIGYVDILAVNVFCDPTAEDCSEKVSAVKDSLRRISSQFNNRPVHITKWGVLDSDDSTVLLNAMESTPGFFTEGSIVERIYWYGGDSPGTTNLRMSARNNRLGLIWSQTCANIG